MVFERTAASHRDRPLLFSERTHPSAIGTGLLFTQLAGLLLRRGFQSARQQSTHGRHPYILHLGQINVEPRALLAPLLPHNDFSPALGQFLNALEILCRRFARRHVASLQRLPSVSPDEILP
jgi:hypothetical protein